MNRIRGTSDDGIARGVNNLRSRNLPERNIADEFLERVPEKGHVLDFGCGVGRWSEALHMARPDLIFDVLDKNMSKLSRNFEGKPWIENQLDMPFQEFRAGEHHYDAIWARSSLYFLKEKELVPVLDELAKSLKPGGALMLNFVTESPMNSGLGYHGQSPEKLAALLHGAGFQVDRIVEENNAVCGDHGQQTIPTYLVHAHKK